MKRLASPAAFAMLLAACATAPKPGAARADVQRAAGRAEVPSPARPGERAPRFTVRGLDGREVGLAIGRVNLVFFWATWSEPDKKAIPRLQEIFERHGPAGLAMLGLSVDDEPGLVAEFVRTCGGRFPVAWDEERRIATLYDARCEPTYFVIDRRGVVRFEHCGYGDADAEQIDAEISALLREPP
ncbi:MAG: TlpA family protein disulfide reductase [Labilithrix sp.]|nr:TlpA family protein disulfide reductase [Labilithrix sp.]MBX3217887.1 TlpA family protein disulfide reductase [Labilithrix sp.]